MGKNAKEGQSVLSETTFADSYERVFGTQIRLGESANHFFDDFYDTFLASSPEVAKAFCHTDMSVQKNMLKRSLLYSINFMTNQNNFDSMERIAVSHDAKHYDIKPELYQLWMDCMVKTVQKHDPKYNADVELAWRLAFAPGITYMQFMRER